MNQSVTVMFESVFSKFTMFYGTFSSMKISYVIISFQIAKKIVLKWKIILKHVVRNVGRKTWPSSRSGKICKTGRQLFAPTIGYGCTECFVKLLNPNLKLWKIEDCLNLFFWPPQIYDFGIPLTFCWLKCKRF